MVFAMRASSDVQKVDSGSHEKYAGPHATDRRILKSLAVVICTMACASPPLAWAGDDIVMTAAQIKAIGIQLKLLDKPVQATGVAYPGRAVLPRAKEQMISAAVTGVVDQVLVEEHAIVQAGQPLLRLNSPEFGELQLKLLEANNQARVAGSTLSREKSLVVEGIVPARRLIEAQALASNAQAAQQQARAAIRLAGADEATMAKIAAGQVQPHLELRAPRTGTVLAIEVKPGQRVAEAEPLVRMAELGTLWLDVEIPAERADAWDPAATMRVVDRDVTARPLSVSAQVNGSQTALLRAEVIQGVERLRPGEFVQVQVPMRAAGHAWVLPNAAVVHQDERNVLFVRTSDGFVARDVRIVAESANGVSVTGALKSVDQIAVAGTIALKAAWLGERGGEEE